MMMNYQTLDADRGSIVLMRVENGWIVRTDDPDGMGRTTPLRVAETPAKLCDIVRDWAASQVPAVPDPRLKQAHDNAMQEYAQKAVDLPPMKAPR